MKLLLTLGLLATMLGMGTGHNWMNNPVTRTATISKASPCPPKPMEHFVSISVRQGELFPVEWSSGHEGPPVPGRFVYFVIIKKDDETKLSKLSERNLMQYLQSGGGKDIIKENLKFTKIHSRWKKNFDGRQDEAKLYNGEIKQGDKDYFTRPQTWRKNINAAGNPDERGPDDEVLYRYRTTDNDKFVIGGNHPFILGVAQFHLQSEQPMNHDIAHLQLDESFAPGDYIIQFYYKGYYVSKLPCIFMQSFPLICSVYPGISDQVFCFYAFCVLCLRSDRTAWT